MKLLFISMLLLSPLAFSNKAVSSDEDLTEKWLRESELAKDYWGLFYPEYTKSPDIHKFVRQGRLKELQNLLEKGVENINEKNKRGETALHYLATQKQKLPKMELLLEYGADPTITRKSNNWTPVHTAAFHGHTGGLKKLFEYGGKKVLNARTEFGWTPLHLASAKGGPETAALLIEEGADIEAQDVNGQTALDWAKLEKQTKTVKWLRSKGAKPGFDMRKRRPKRKVLDMEERRQIDQNTKALTSCANVFAKSP